MLDNNIKISSMVLSWTNLLSLSKFQLRQLEYFLIKSLLNLCSILTKLVFFIDFFLLILIE